MKTGRCEQMWVGTPGRRCDCSGRRQRFAPPPASAAATAAQRAHPPSLTATSFHKISFYSAKIKQFTQPKRIYSANGNPFMPMIWRFFAYSSTLKCSLYSTKRKHFTLRLPYNIAFLKLNFGASAIIEIRPLLHCYFVSNTIVLHFLTVYADVVGGFDKTNSDTFSSW